MTAIDTSFALSGTSTGAENETETEIFLATSLSTPVSIRPDLSFLSTLNPEKPDPVNLQRIQFNHTFARAFLLRQFVNAGVDIDATVDVVRRFLALFNTSAQWFRFRVRSYHIFVKRIRRFLNICRNRRQVARRDLLDAWRIRDNQRRKTMQVKIYEQYKEERTKAKDKGKFRMDASLLGSYVDLFVPDKWKLVTVQMFYRVQIRKWAMEIRQWIQQWKDHQQRQRLEMANWRKLQAEFVPDGKAMAQSEDRLRTLAAESFALQLASPRCRIIPTEQLLETLEKCASELISGAVPQIFLRDMDLLRTMHDDQSIGVQGLAVARGNSVRSLLGLRGVAPEKCVSESANPSQSSTGGDVNEDESPGYRSLSPPTSEEDGDRLDHSHSFSPKPSLSRFSRHNLFLGPSITPEIITPSSPQKTKGAAGASRLLISRGLSPIATSRPTNDLECPLMGNCGLRLHSPTKSPSRSSLLKPKLPPTTTVTASCCSPVGPTSGASAGTRDGLPLQHGSPSSPSHRFSLMHSSSVPVMRWQRSSPSPRNFHLSHSPPLQLQGQLHSTASLKRVKSPPLAPLASPPVNSNGGGGPLLPLRNSGLFVSPPSLVPVVGRPVTGFNQ